MTYFRTPKAEDTAENTEKLKAVAMAAATVVSMRLWWRGEGRGEIAALWMAMGAIVSTLQLELERPATLATAVAFRPRSMKKGEAEGVIAAPVTTAAARQLARVESITSKRGKT